jgi:hypothetical protein
LEQEIVVKALCSNKSSICLVRTLQIFTAAYLYSANKVLKVQEDFTVPVQFCLLETMQALVISVEDRKEDDAKENLTFSDPSNAVCCLIKNFSDNVGTR